MKGLIAALLFLCICAVMMPAHGANKALHIEGCCKQKDSPNEIQIEQTTRDGTKWRAIWFREDCKLPYQGWKEAYPAGTILVDFDLAEPGKNAYILRHAVMRGAVVMHTDIAARGYAPPLKPGQIMPGWLMSFVEMICTPNTSTPGKQGELK